MNKKKSIAVAAVLTLILLIGGMLAYFTDTDDAHNTFTIGNIDIELTEPHWVAANAENMVPGQTVAKDPVVTNTDNSSQAAYVFVEAIVPAYAVTNNGTTTYLPMFSLDSTGAGWTRINSLTYTFTDSESNNPQPTITYVYAYGTASAMTSLAVNTSTPTAAFSSITLDPAITHDQTRNGEIEVNAYGIQSTNLGDDTRPETVYHLIVPDSNTNP